MVAREWQFILIVLCARFWDLAGAVISTWGLHHIDLAPLWYLIDKIYILSRPSVRPSVRPSIRQVCQVRPSVRSSVRPSVCLPLPVRPHAQSSVRLSVCLSVCPSGYRPVWSACWCHLSVCSSVRLSGRCVCLSGLQMSVYMCLSTDMLWST